MDDQAPVGNGGESRLPLIGGARKATFTSRGRALGLGPEQIDELWAIGSSLGEGGFAPADQRTGALFEAAHRSAEVGAPTFYLQMKVGDLATLNQTRGHTGANAAMKKARAAALARLKGMFGDIQPMAERASGFGFIVAGDASLTEERLQEVATSVAAGVQEEEGIPLQGYAMPVDDAATAAVDSDQFTESSTKSAHEHSSTVPASSAQADSPVGFKSSGADRRRKFLATADGFGVKGPEAAELYGLMLESRVDKLTGFEGAADREATVRKAAQQVTEQGVVAMYVDIDIRNVGGLNEALGKRKTDEWFLKITSITESHMASLAGVADAVPFRHGGDEFSFVVVATGPEIDTEKLEQAVTGALDLASAQIADETKAVAHVKHPKGADRPSGTGIVWGTSAIGPGQDPEEVFAAADQVVESKKSGSLTPTAS